MTYHSNNANQLEVKRDCNRSRLVDNRVRVFVVVFKQVFIESCLIRFHCGFCKATKGKREKTKPTWNAVRVFETSWALILWKHSSETRAPAWWLS